MKWDKEVSQERWGTKAIRVLLVRLVPLDQEGSQDHRVKSVRLGCRDHLGLQDQRAFLGTLEYQGPTVLLDQRVCKVPEGPKAHQGHREHRVMKDHSAHLAAPALLEELEGRATLANLAQRV